MSKYITGSPLNPDHLEVAIQNIHFIDLFILANWKLLLIFFIAAIVFLYTLIQIRRKLNIVTRNMVILFFVIVALTANVIYVSKANANRNPFYAYNLPIVCVNALNYPKIPYVPRSKVATLPGNAHTPDLVVFIIDESATYEALRSYGSIISKPKELSSTLNAPVFFYKAHSAGNHSAIANYVLRLGLGKSSYPDKEGKTLAAPTIFSYAKAAGYTTVFYDAQAEQNQLQNYMSYFDLADIDTFITSDAMTKRYQRDTEAISKLRPVIAGASPDNKIMVMIVKYGVHFPYINSIPDQIAATLPESCRSSDTSFTSADKSCNKIQYEAALKYSVDGFMDMLLGIVRGKNFALVYTADHGQNIYSNHTFPHGSLENVSECEISVPIFLAGSCFYALKQTEDIKSHFQIPATIQSIMGFDSGLSQKEATLWEYWDDDETYLYDLFGDNRRWLKISDVCKY